MSSMLLMIHLANEEKFALSGRFQAKQGDGKRKQADPCCIYVNVNGSDVLEFPAAPGELGGERPLEDPEWP